MKKNTFKLLFILSFIFVINNLLFSAYRIRTGGSIKIDSDGITEPTYNLIAGVPQQILYSTPTLDSESYYPRNTKNKNVTSVYSSDVVVGTITYHGIYLENPILGQPQYWRVSFNYENKSINASEGIRILLRNPISGFERTCLSTLPEGITFDTFITEPICTYADRNSLPAPWGTGTGGYQFFIESTKQNIDVIIKDISRLNWEY